MTRDEQEYRDLCVEYVELTHMFFSDDRGDYRKMSAALRSTIRFRKEKMQDGRAKQLADLREAQNQILRLQAAAAFGAKRPIQKTKPLPGPSIQQIHAVHNRSTRTIHEVASEVRKSSQSIPFSTIVIIASPWILLAMGGWQSFPLWDLLLYSFALIVLGMLLAFTCRREILARFRRNQKDVGGEP